jgi:hypothetical protein
MMTIDFREILPLPHDHGNSRRSSALNVPGLCKLAESTPKLITLSLNEFVSPVEDEQKERIAGTSRYLLGHPRATLNKGP